MLNKKRLAMMALAASMVLPNNLVAFSNTPVLAQSEFDDMQLETGSTEQINSFETYKDSDGNGYTLNEAKTYTLTQSIENLEKTINITGKGVIIDLGNYNITSGAKLVFTIADNASLEIKGTGQIISSFKNSDNWGEDGSIIQLKGANAALTIGGATLTVSNPIVENLTANTQESFVYGVSVMDTALSSKIELTETTIKAPGGITVNGNLKDDSKSPEIILSGVTIEAHTTSTLPTYGSLGIYQAGSSEITIKENSNISSDRCAIEIRRGTLDVSKSTIVGGSDSATTSTPNNNGSTVEYAGIAVAQYHKNGPITVKVKDKTEVSGKIALAITDPNNHQNGGTPGQCDPSISITVSDSTLTGTQTCDVGYTTQTIGFTLVNTTLANNETPKECNVTNKILTPKETNTDPVPYSIKEVLSLTDATTAVLNLDKDNALVDVTLILPDTSEGAAQDATTEEIINKDDIGEDKTYQVVDSNGTAVDFAEVTKETSGLKIVEVGKESANFTSITEIKIADNEDEGEEALDLTSATAAVLNLDKDNALVDVTLTLPDTSEGAAQDATTEEVINKDDIGEGKTYQVVDSNGAAVDFAEVTEETSGLKIVEVGKESANFTSITEIKIATEDDKNTEVSLNNATGSITYEADGKFATLTFILDGEETTLTAKDGLFEGITLEPTTLTPAEEGTITPVEVKVKGTGKSGDTTYSGEFTIATADVEGFELTKDQLENEVKVELPGNLPAIELPLGTLNEDKTATYNPELDSIGTALTKTFNDASNYSDGKIPNYTFTVNQDTTKNPDVASAVEDEIQVSNVVITFKLPLPSEKDSYIRLVIPNVVEMIPQVSLLFEKPEAANVVDGTYSEVVKVSDVDKNNDLVLSKQEISDYLNTKDLTLPEEFPANYELNLSKDLPAEGIQKDGYYAVEITQDNNDYVAPQPPVSTGTSGNKKPSKPKPEEPAAPVVGTPTPMYRLYNRLNGEHLFTTDKTERDNLLTSDTWKDEGQGWTAPSVSDTPVYRLLNPNTGDHHYTTDKNEFDTLPTYGWVAEGIAFYSADKDNADNVILHRLYNPNATGAGSHHYTADTNERDTLVAQGWKYEGTAWAGLKN